MLRNMIRIDTSKYSYNSDTTTDMFHYNRTPPFSRCEPTVSTHGHGGINFDGTIDEHAMRGDGEICLLLLFPMPTSRDNIFRRRLPMYTQRPFLFHLMLAFFSKIKTKPIFPLPCSRQCLYWAPPNAAGQFKTTFPLPSSRQCLHWASLKTAGQLKTTPVQPLATTRKHYSITTRRRYIGSSSTPKTYLPSPSNTHSNDVTKSRDITTYDIK